MSGELSWLALPDCKIQFWVVFEFNGDLQSSSKTIDSLATIDLPQHSLDVVKRGPVFRLLDPAVVHDHRQDGVDGLVGRPGCVAVRSEEGRMTVHDPFNENCQKDNSIIII